MKELSELEIINKIKALKPAPYFEVGSDAQRNAVNRIAKHMRLTGIVEFEVMTKQFGDKGYKVIAV